MSESEAHKSMTAAKMYALTSAIKEGMPQEINRADILAAVIALRASGSFIVPVSYLVGGNIEPIIRPVIFPAIRRPMRLGMALAGFLCVAACTSPKNFASA